MRVALLTTFAADRKEPLAALVARIHRAFFDAGLGAPAIEFSFADAPVAGFTSGVDRALKKHPAMARFESRTDLPGGASIRRLSNDAASSAAGEPIEFATLSALAGGVPRSFPFHTIAIRFHSPAFGDAAAAAMPGLHGKSGVLVGDAWWVNGRQRSLAALTIVEADPSGRELPPPTVTVQAVLTACGKVKERRQIPLGDAPAAVNPQAAQAVRSIVADYRARLAGIVDAAALAHDLPSALDALKSTPAGEASGPKKPALVAAFKPLGYNVKGGSGTFTLHRRTASNLSVTVDLDVGTWSNMLTASFGVTGLGFRARLPLPVSRHSLDAPQYKIGGASRWQQLVDNLAALVREYDRTFVPAIEAAAGPSPEWYSPRS